MKKIITIILCVVLLAGGAVGLYFGVFRDSTPNLTVSMADVTVTKGETAELNYTCSISAAVITFEVENKSVATVEYANERPVIVAHNSGSTTVTLVANYKTFKNSCKATIKVVEDDPDDPVVDELTFSNKDHITFENDVFTMSVGTTAMFTILANFDIDIINEVAATPEGVTITKITEMSKTYSLTSNDAGTYSLTIRINSNKTFTYTLIVQ